MLTDRVGKVSHSVHSCLKTVNIERLRAILRRYYGHKGTISPCFAYVLTALEVARMLVCLTPKNRE